MYTCWRKELNIIDIPGDHTSIMQKPSIKKIASIQKSILKQSKCNEVKSYAN
jgi:thioesterase domain-containing protein